MFKLIAGNCVIESEELAIHTAGYLKEICSDLNIEFVFKSSFQKANRTSINSYTGPGLEKGLQILEKVKTEIGCMYPFHICNILRKLDSWDYLNRSVLG